MRGGTHGLDIAERQVEIHGQRFEAFVDCHTLIIGSPASLLTRPRIHTLLILPQHPLDISLRLRIRRDAPISRHPSPPPIINPPRAPTIPVLLAHYFPPVRPSP